MKVANKEELGFWGLAVSVLVLGVALIVVRPQEGARRSLGDALIIAAVLAITVDKYLKRRLVRELAHNVFHFLIGYDLPPEARDRIREIVTKSTLIRRDSELNYRIEVVPGDPEKVRVQLTSTFSLDNITSEELTYRFRTATACSARSGRFVRLWCHSRQSGAVYEYPPPELKMDGPDDEGNYWISGKEVKIPPRNFEKDLRFEIGCRYESVSEHRSDTENYEFMYPTLRVRVKIEYPEDEFTVVPVPKPSAMFGKFEWTYDRFFVSGEQVAIRWTRKGPVRRKSDPESFNFQREVPEPVAMSPKVGS